MHGTKSCLILLFLTAKEEKFKGYVLFVASSILWIEKIGFVLSHCSCPVSFIIKLDRGRFFLFQWHQCVKVSNRESSVVYSLF